MDYWSKRNYIPNSFFCDRLGCAERIMQMKRNKLLPIFIVALIIVTIFTVGICQSGRSTNTSHNEKTSEITSEVSFSQFTYSQSAIDIPEYDGKPYTVLNNNQPEFDDFDTMTAFETYSELDSLGRCGAAYANICKDLTPTKDRESISDTKPSGWTYNGNSNNRKYDIELVDGGYIYNRCHLIAFQLSGENNNPQNLITGTRSLNIDGMLPFENIVANYIKEKGGHVLYRVTPRFVDNELVCRGVQIEAYSVEDNGADVCFNVFCFNVQPGIEINYMTGENRISETISTTGTNSGTLQYVINENSKKFHYPNCDAVKKINAENKLVLVGSKEQLLNQGYSPCKICKP